MPAPTAEIFDRLLTDGDDTTTGNYFVANYPPSSQIAHGEFMQTSQRIEKHAGANP